MIDRFDRYRGFVCLGLCYKSLSSLISSSHIADLENYSSLRLITDWRVSRYSVNWWLPRRSSSPGPTHVKGSLCVSCGAVREQEPANRGHVRPKSDRFWLLPHDICVADAASLHTRNCAVEKGGHGRHARQGWFHKFLAYQIALVRVHADSPRWVSWDCRWDGYWGSSSRGSSPRAM